MPRRPRIMINDSRIAGGKYILYSKLQYSPSDKSWVFGSMFSTLKRDLKIFKK